MKIHAKFNRVHKSIFIKVGLDRSPFVHVVLHLNLNERIIYVLQIYGRTDMPNIQCTFNDQRIRKLCQRNPLLDGEYD